MTHMTNYHPKMDSLEVGSLCLLAEKFELYGSEVQWYRGAIYKVDSPIIMPLEMNFIRELCPIIGTPVILVQTHLDMNPDYVDVLHLLEKKGHLGRQRAVEVLYEGEKYLTSVEFLWNDDADVSSITSLSLCHADIKNTATLHYVWGSRPE